MVTSSLTICLAGKQIGDCAWLGRGVKAHWWHLLDGLGGRGPATLSVCHLSAYKSESNRGKCSRYAIELFSPRPPDPQCRKAVGWAVRHWTGHQKKGRGFLWLPGLSLNPKCRRKSTGFTPFKGNPQDTSLSQLLVTMSAGSHSHREGASDILEIQDKAPEVSFPLGT